MFHGKNANAKNGMVKAGLAALFFCLFIYPHLYAADIKDSSSPQINWLKSQQNDSTGLVDSYEGDGQDYAYTYDQALAIIAFTEVGEEELSSATKLLGKMKDLQDSSGRWYQCYDASTGNLGSPAGNFYPTGDIAWMVIAINFYEGRTGDKQYSNMAEKALGWLDTMRNTEPDDERYGSLRLCSGTSCQYPNAISTENNHDAYSAYFWRGWLSGNNSYTEKANLIKDYLIREMWAPSPTSNGPYHNVNVFWVGFNDFGWCTDVQSWGVLALGATGPNGEEFYKSLEWLYYNPYGSTRNQQDYNLNIQDVDGFRLYTEDPEYIWLEGTEGVASAFYSIGDDDRGNYFHGQTGRVASPNGGIIYSFTETVPDDFPEGEKWRLDHRYNSVAATAWYYFNERKINPFEDPRMPDPATDLTATALSPTSVELTWQDNSDNEVGFKIYRREPDNPNPAEATWKKIFTTAPGVTEYTDTRLTPNTYYIYRVRAYNSAGIAAFAGPARITTPESLKPEPVTNVWPVALSVTSVRITWRDNSDDEFGFKIFRRRPIDPLWSRVILATPNLTEYIDTGLLPETEYIYRVRPYNEHGTSMFITAPRVTTLSSLMPACATDVTLAALSPTSVKVEWTDNSDNELGFKIFRRRPIDPTWSRVILATPNLTEYIDTGLTPSTTYIYRVRSYNEYGTTMFIGAPRVTTPVSGRPEPPSELTGEAVSPTSVRLTWTDNADNELGFRVYRRVTSSSDWTVIYLKQPDVTEYTDTGLEPSTRYVYRVYAYNMEGLSLNPPKVIITTPALPPPLFSRVTTDGYRIMVEIKPS